MDEIKKAVKKRAPRKVSPEKQIASIDRKIAKIQAESEKKIAELQAQKDALLKPIKAKQVVEEAIKSMTPEELAEKLGLSLD